MSHHRILTKDTPGQEALGSVKEDSTLTYLRKIMVAIDGIEARISSLSQAVDNTRAEIMSLQETTKVIHNWVLELKLRQGAVSSSGEGLQRASGPRPILARPR